MSLQTERDSAHWQNVRFLTHENDLRDIIGHPAELLKSKIVAHLNAHTRQFIERSPFLCLATSDAQGRCDVSPRGDAPGFVRILDERTLLVPERPGNKLADSLRNILENPQVGLLFILPGIDDTFRVNGRAFITDDADLLLPSSAEGKPPRLGIVVFIEEAYTQCGKAFIRSQLWDGQRHLQRGCLPSAGEILRSLKGEDFDAGDYDQQRDARYARRENFY